MARRYRFYLSDGSASAAANDSSMISAGARLPLPDGEAHHATHVLRLGDGAEVDVVVAGRAFAARLESADGGAWMVVLERETAAADSTAATGAAPLILAPSLTKGDAFEWTLEKATELGAAAIVPVVADRCVVQLDAKRAEKKLERWRKIIVGATKQCERLTAPELSEPAPLAKWGSELPPDRVILLAERDAATAPLAAHLRALAAIPSAPRDSDSDTPAPIALLIGPEGGWTEKEFDLARARGWRLASLGPRVLRAETAAIAALALAQSVLGDLA